MTDKKRNTKQLTANEVLSHLWKKSQKAEIMMEVIIRNQVEILSKLEKKPIDDVNNKVRQRILDAAQEFNEKQ